ncbi:MAG: hypothetical protein HY329_15135, partial [Chloroflexi bacterium]|nr:hypothetical protein [Chloroflexota bacterium]
QILMEAAKEGQKLNRDRALKENETAIELMKQNGVQVTRPDLEPFRAKVTGVYKQFEGQVGPELLKQAQEEAQK